MSYILLVEKTVILSNTNPVQLEKACLVEETISVGDTGLAPIEGSLLAFQLLSYLFFHSKKGELHSRANLRKSTLGKGVLEKAI